MLVLSICHHQHHHHPHNHLHESSQFMLHFKISIHVKLPPLVSVNDSGAKTVVSVPCHFLSWINCYVKLDHPAMNLPTVGLAPFLFLICLCPLGKRDTVRVLFSPWVLTTWWLPSDWCWGSGYSGLDLQVTYSRSGFPDACPPSALTQIQLPGWLCCTSK